MFKSKPKISQEEYDEAIANAYKLGYRMGQVEERNRQWISQADGMTFVEKQILAILEKEKK